MNPLLLKVPEQLTTKRLLLRAVRPEDAGQLNDAITESFRELHPWMPWARTRPKRADTEEFCRQAAIDFEARREFPMVMLRRSDGELLGGTGLVRGDWLVPKFEVGYWVRTAHAGNGYATEAARALTRFARRHLRVRRLEIRTDARNQRSARVARQAGFTLEGTLRNDARDNRSQLRDTLMFARIF